MALNYVRGLVGGDLKRIPHGSVELNMAYITHNILGTI